MGDVVVVQGSGPVGLSAAAFAARRGAGAVIVIGAPKARLSLAEQLGADTVLLLDQDAVEARRDAIGNHSGGRGADVIIEASGNPAAVTEGLDLLRDGGTYVVAGHYTDAGSVPINPHTQVNRKHADVRGQWGTDFRHVVRALRLFAKHRAEMPFERVVGARYGLDAAGQALADVAALRVTKAVIDPALSP
jgi:L-iditol 2-dehydrogenase